MELLKQSLGSDTGHVCAEVLEPMQLKQNKTKQKKKDEDFLKQVDLIKQKCLFNL